MFNGVGIVLWFVEEMWKKYKVSQNCGFIGHLLIFLATFL